jgi:hypothetical protein
VKINAEGGENKLFKFLARGSCLPPGARLVIKSARVPSLFPLFSPSLSVIILGRLLVHGLPARPPPGTRFVHISPSQISETVRLA